MTYPLVMTVTVCELENGPFIAFIVHVPNLKMVIFDSKLLVYQRVTQKLPKEKLFFNASRLGPRFHGNLLPSGSQYVFMICTTRHIPSEPRLGCFLFALPDSLVARKRVAWASELAGDPANMWTWSQSLYIQFFLSTVAKKRTCKYW